MAVVVVAPMASASPSACAAFTSTAVLALVSAREMGMKLPTGRPPAASTSDSALLVSVCGVVAQPRAGRGQAAGVCGWWREAPGEEAADCEAAH